MGDMELGEKTFPVKIKLTNQEKELVVNISSSDNVAVLEKEIRKQLSIHNSQQLRLISSGKMLSLPSQLLSSFNLAPNSYIHAVITERKTTNSASSSGISSITSNHRSNSNLEDGRQGTGGENRILGGLDQLLSEGLSVEEVASLRSYFRNDIDEYIRTTSNEGEPDRRANEDQIEYRARMESEWMALQGAHSEFILNLPRTSATRIRASGGFGGNGNGNGNSNGSVGRQPLIFSIFSRLRAGTVGPGASINENNLPAGTTTTSTSTFQTPATETITGDDEGLGTYKDLMFGLWLGLFFGFMSILCLWESNVTYRQKVGILIGVMIQLISGMVGGNAADSADKNTDRNGGLTSTSSASVPSAGGDSNSDGIMNPLGEGLLGGN